MLRVIELDRVNSTNDHARSAFAGADAEAMLVVARTQSGGRGRLGRAWRSPEGGVWCTLAWGRAMPMTLGACAGMVGALSARESVLDACGPGAQGRVLVKWPNDLMLLDPRDGRLRKIGGVLGERDAAGPLLVGIGINADFDERELDQPDEPLRTPATTLRSALGVRTDPLAIAHDLGQRLAQDLLRLEREGFAPFAEAINGSLALAGERTSWATPSGVVEGCAIGVDAHGRLELATDGGVVRLVSGETSRVVGGEAGAAGVSPRGDGPGRAGG